MNNTFCSKASIMNEFYRFAIIGVDWGKLYGFVSDQRIGDSHFMFLDHGKLIWRQLFPKDINAFISFAKIN